MDIAPLVIAGVPTNIRLPAGSRGTHVDSDMFDISQRLAAIDPALRIDLLEHVDGRAVWAVNEEALDGSIQLIMRVGPGCAIDELDGRVVARINWIRRIPAGERARVLERELQAEAAYRAVQERERLYDSIGGTFYDGLHRFGFIQTPKPESVRPLNKTARRAGRRI